jgi:hypothetical protein
MNTWKLALVGAGLLWGSAAMAQKVTIADIPNAEHVEVTVVGTEEYLSVSELESLKFPLSAQQQKDRTLHFKHKNKQYSVSRADVTLINEKLVNDPCNTVPSTVAGNTRLASIKGAGESCK